MDGNKTKYLKYGLHIAILIGLVYAIVKYVNGEEVLKALQTFQYRYLPFMLALTVIFFLLKAWRFAILMGPFADHVPTLTIFKGYIAGQAATLLPGGIAARAGLMKQAGVPVAESSVPVAVHSGYDQLIFLAGSLVAAFFIAEARLPVLVILGVLGAVAMLLLVPHTRRLLAGLAERIARRFDAQEQWQRFLDSVPKVFTAKIVAACLVLSAVSFLANVLVLDLTLRGSELSVSYPTLFLAFILPTMLGRVVPIPGGVGVTEAGMVGFLTATARLDTDAVVAAVTIYRVVTIVFQALIGAVVYFLFWRGDEEASGQAARTEEGRPGTAKLEATHASNPHL